jgi:hypothetical protein
MEQDSKATMFKLVTLLTLIGIVKSLSAEFSSVALPSGMLVYCEHIGNSTKSLRTSAQKLYVGIGRRPASVDSEESITFSTKVIGLGFEGYQEPGLHIGFRYENFVVSIFCLLNSLMLTIIE